MNSFADYYDEAHSWITLSTGEYYPDVLPLASELYGPVLVLFGQLLAESHSSTDLMMRLSQVSETWMRIQLARVFRKYVSPETPVEMLKQKRKAALICEQFGAGFRRIDQVHAAFAGRPIPDETLCALLWEYKDRGKKGYDLTERLFAILRENLTGFTLSGPERAGRDVLMGTIFPGYPKPDRPIDFLICENETPIAIGLARYDSDRGGAQEDDRTGQYRDCANEVLQFDAQQGTNLKVIFLNDGPGLLLGSMWRDYSAIEAMNPDRIKVVTLRMVADRITPEWLRS